MTPRLAVLVPTRGSTELLHKMLESLVTTAADPYSLEIVFRIDDDDTESRTYLLNQAVTCWLNMIPQHSIVVGPHLNGYATLPIMINEASARAKAPLQIVINDDVQFKSKGWDAKLCEVAATYPDGIFNLAVDTVMNNANCVFPCQSKTQIDTLGFFFDPRLVYPDIWLRDVLQPFGRIVRVPDVVIEHQWVGMTHDQQQAVSLVHGRGYSELYNRCVLEGREKIEEALRLASAS